MIIWAGFVVFSLIEAVSHHSIGLGIFVALIGSAGVILGTSQSLSQSFADLSKQTLEITYYQKFMDLPERDDEADDSQFSAASPHIIFKNVHFTYPNTETEILKGISFEILPHQRVSLVGENGAGKSTLIKLLCRLYEPTSGQITINGIDIKDLSAKQLRQVFSVVFQDFFSYSLTLRENIAFGAIEKLRDDSALKNALKEGLAGDILGELPQGLDGSLGKLEEDGRDLSGGQWQRLALSRACLADSSFVILDEPTASLDPLAESAMYQSFAEVLKTKGCIMISHRLASARLADTILVLADGNLAEKGTHAELMAQYGLYAAMFNLQSSWYESVAAHE